MIVQLSGDFPENISTVEARGEQNESLYGYFRKVEKEFNVMVKEKHQNKGCITFLIARKDDDPIILKVHRERLKEAQKKQGSNQKVQLHLMYETLFFQRAPISPPQNVCGQMQNLSNDTSIEFTLPFIAQAHAQDPSSISTHELIEFLKSDDGLKRYDAQQLLSDKEPEVIDLIMNDLLSR